VNRSTPRTLAISQRHTADGGDLVDWARAIAAAGVDAIQLREKDLDARRLLEVATALVEILPAGVRLLVNGRLDVAIASGAAGVHLPANGLPSSRARQRFPGLVLGVSTHHRDEVAAARDDGADYVVFGPVFAPISKDSPLAPVGIGELERVCALGVPVLALGGVTITRLPEIAAAGAAGVAGIGAFRAPADAAAFIAAAHRLFAPMNAAARPPAVAR
jgi:thiamine-phosphate pyrophosphorylase